MLVPKIKTQKNNASKFSLKLKVDTFGGVKVHIYRWGRLLSQSVGSSLSRMYYLSSLKIESFWFSILANVLLAFNLLLKIKYIRSFDTICFMTLRKSWSLICILVCRLDILLKDLYICCFACCGLCVMRLPMVFSHHSLKFRCCSLYI